MTRFLTVLARIWVFGVFAAIFLPLLLIFVI